MAGSPITPFLIFLLVSDCSGSSPSISNAFGFFRRKEAGVFLVEFKEEGDAFGFGFKIGFAVGGINGAVEGLMGFKKHRWSRLEKNIQ